MPNEDPKLIIAKTLATDLDCGTQGNTIGYPNAVAITAALDAAGFVIISTKLLSELKATIAATLKVMG